MFNAVTKIFSGAAVALLLLTACNSKEKAEAEATRLSEMADSAISVRNFALATQLLDSVDHAYREATETRRANLYRRARLKEAQTIRDMEIEDSLMVVASIKGDSALKEQRFHAARKLMFQRRLEVIRSQMARTTTDTIAD